MQAIGFAIQERVALPAARLVGNAVLRQKLGDGAQSGQRRPELVRDGGDEVGLEPSDTGFLADAARLQSALDAGKIAATKVAETQGLIFNGVLLV